MAGPPELVLGLLLVHCDREDAGTTIGTPRSRSEFVTTLTEERAIAPAAKAGFRRTPKAG
jgi:hypothetical protein